jgi:hypothetical protein
MLLAQAADPAFSVQIKFNPLRVMLAALSAGFHVVIFEDTAELK